MDKLLKNSVQLKENAERFLVGFTVSQAIIRSGLDLYRKIKSGLEYTVTIDSRDDIYEDLHTWLLSMLPVDKQRSILAMSKSKGQQDPSPYYEGQKLDDRKEVLLQYDGSRSQTVSIEGHPIKVQIRKSESNRFDISRMSLATSTTMVFTSNTNAGKEALIKHMNHILRENKLKKTGAQFKILSNYGDWIYRNDVQKRSLDSVILKQNQLENLIEDIERFLQSEDEYNRLSIPWHRGYLFWGPPGSGKTSVARALANHFHLNMHYLPLGDLKNDGHLMTAIGGVPAKSLLLLEDIDVFHAATSRDDDAPISLSGLLNSLDGMNTPHGLITIMTTNDLSALDPALIRAGRIDRREEFSHLDADQTQRMVKWFCGIDTEVSEWSRIKEKNMSPAELTELLFKAEAPDVCINQLRAILS